MTKKPRTHEAQVKASPVELADAGLDAVSAGVDPSNPNVVYVGGSRYAAGDPDQPILVGGVPNHKR